MTEILSSLSRRGLLSFGCAGLSAAAMAAIPRLALGKAVTDRRLIVVLLRGGIDGLAAIPPYADPAYAAARGSLALPEPGRADGIADLNGFFGIHPALENVRHLYSKGDAALFHAVASPYRERSHFDAQNLLELGTETPHAAPDGWLNRVLSLMGPGASSLGVAFNQTIPPILTGDVPVSSWAPGGTTLPADFLLRLELIYAHDPLFAQTLAQAQSADELAGQAEAAMRRNASGMGASDLGNRLMRRTIGTAAEMLKAEDGHRIAVIEIGGWDTHANQGTVNGQLTNRLRQLDEGIGMLSESLAPVWDETAILLMTEFGRTVSVNGTGGTDHGTAGIAMLIGGAVNGGVVLSHWPGLAQQQLYEGRDLAPTLDLRSIVKGVLHELYGLGPRELDSVVFSGSSATGRVRDIISA